MSRRTALRSPAVSACLVIGLAAAPAGAEWFRLSDGQTFSDVLTFQVSPDGRWAVYTHNTESVFVLDLWSVLLPTGPPLKLNGLLPAGGLGQFLISPDSARVVYRAEQDTGGVDELYSVPIAGPATARVKLNPTLVAGGGVVRFQISPDGTRVIYLADQQTDEVDELYSVPIAGPASSGVKLNGAMTVGGDVAVFEVSPDGERVIYLADQQTDEVHELYSVPVAGPALQGIKLNLGLVTGGDVVEFLISPDGSRVVYRADRQTDEVLELYSVPIAGPASSGVKLNGALVAGGDVEQFPQISADSARVVYPADQQTNNVVELYSVPIAGPSSSGVKLSGALVAGGAIDWAVLDISLDGAYVIYRADQQIDQVFELFSVPIAGPASAGIKLSGPMVMNGDVEVRAHEISPDSTWAVYVADQEIDGWPMGYRVPLTGPTGSDDRIWATAVNDPSTFQILPDSSAVAVLGNSAFVDSVVRLWTYPLAGTPGSQGTDWLGGEFQPNGDVTTFQVLPDGSGAVYEADQEIDEQNELYVVYFRLWGDGFETGDASRWSDVVP